MMLAPAVRLRESSAAPALLMLVVPVSGMLGLVLANVGLRVGPGAARSGLRVLPAVYGRAVSARLS